MTTYTQAKPAGMPTWVELLSPDVEAARKFYQAMFGWNYAINADFGGYSTARLGDRTAAGLYSPQPGDAPSPSAWSLYFASENIEADVSRAVALGAKVIAPAMPVGPLGSMAVLQDPTGATFGFWKSGMHIGWQVADEPGAANWFELYSTNAKQARDFYAALLNASADTMPGGMEYYVLKHGETMLAGIMQIEASWGNMPSQWGTYFEVANADEAAATATRNGGKQLGGVDDSPYGRIAALLDPSGAMFKIVQPPQH